MNRLSSVLGYLLLGICIIMVFFGETVMEEIINPGGHYSVHLSDDQVLVADGVACHHDPLPWRLSIESTWVQRYSSSTRVDKARLYAWVDAGTTPTKIEWHEVEEGGQLFLKTCQAETVAVGYLLDVSGGDGSRYLHLRVYPGYQVKADSRAQVPDLVKASLD